MYKLGKRSKDNLSTALPVWTEIVEELCEFMDVSVICGHRNQADQNKAVVDGTSKTHWPNSKHNTFPSVAIDICPYPIDWGNIKRFGYMAGMIKMIAHSKGVSVRWGGDWDSDGDTEDQRFHDLPHFEIVL